MNSNKLKKKLKNLHFPKTPKKKVFSGGRAVFRVNGSIVAYQEFSEPVKWNRTPQAIHRIGNLDIELVEI
jgi:hypothetical protein